MTLSKLKINDIFKQDAKSLFNSRIDAKIIHNTHDIKSAGNEVEKSVRDFLESRFPRNYYIGHGHIIDRNKSTSPQFDIIISDNVNLPILFRTKDSTEYFSAESVYSVGEVKSTYYKQEKPIHKFCESIKLMKTQMHRPIRKNTIFGGQLTDATIFPDMVFGSPLEILNEVYYFMLFINSGDFDISEFEECANLFEKEYLPNQIYFLDSGMISIGEFNDKSFNISRYPMFSDNKTKDWLYMNDEKDNDNSGMRLCQLYSNLIEHITQSQLEPPIIEPYFIDMFITKKSLIKKIKTKA